MKRETDKVRVVWLDWLRVAACLMVMVVHATEPFYIGGEGALVLNAPDAYWASFFDSFVRACVPLFVITSSYLLFPLRTSTATFFRKRAARLVVPFVVWSLVYALVWGEPVDNLKALLLNFNYSAGHLWFVYMLIGLYLVMPLLSPWAEKVGKRELQVYLAVWVFTLFIPFVRDWAGKGEWMVILGPTGIPNPAAYPLWGEASWNSYGLFYYVSGFIGYLLLALYFKRFVPRLSWPTTLAVGLPVWLVGFFICFGGFLFRVFHTAEGGFPAEGGIEKVVGWEVPWYNDTIGVALMTVGWLLLFRKLNADGWFYRCVVLPVSKASYGMYLCHMFVLAWASSLLRQVMGLGDEGVWGVLTTPVQIVLAAMAAFSITAVACTLVQRIPKVGKWLMG